jgi:regulator of RNase E activity RraA
MKQIKEKWPMAVLSSDLLEALREFDSPTISNAVEHFQVRDPTTGYASMELQCQFPGLRPMVGYAVTCTVDTTTAGDQRPMGMGKFLDAVYAAPKPAVIVAQYVGPDRLRSCWMGDMSCSAMWKIGAVGAVTDCGNRDKKGIARRVPSFQIFSPGWVVSHGWGVYLDVGVSVSICGLSIQPGDLVHGDANGILTVPVGIVEGVLEQAKAVQDAEREYFDFLQSDTYSYEEMRDRLVRH